jgi:glycosyltransferase involved in cell wall biosynthesis
MLAEKIELLLNDQKMREAMRESNKKLARQFSAELVAQEYLNVYRNLAAGR